MTIPHPAVVPIVVLISMFGDLECSPEVLDDLVELLLAWTQLTDKAALPQSFNAWLQCVAPHDAPQPAMDVALRVKENVEALVSGGHDVFGTWVKDLSKLCAINEDDETVLNPAPFSRFSPFGIFVRCLRIDFQRMLFPAVIQWWQDAQLWFMQGGTVPSKLAVDGRRPVAKSPGRRADYQAWLDMLTSESTFGSTKGPSRENYLYDRAATQFAFDHFRSAEEAITETFTAAANARNSRIGLACQSLRRRLAAASTAPGWTNDNASSQKPEASSFELFWDISSQSRVGRLQHSLDLLRNDRVETRNSVTTAPRRAAHRQQFGPENRLWAASSSTAAALLWAELGSHTLSRLWAEVAASDLPGNAPAWDLRIAILDLGASSCTAAGRSEEALFVLLRAIDRRAKRVGLTSGNASAWASMVQRQCALPGSESRASSSTAHGTLQGRRSRTDMLKLFEDGEEALLYDRQPATALDVFLKVGRSSEDRRPLWLRSVCRLAQCRAVLSPCSSEAVRGLCELEACWTLILEQGLHDLETEAIGLEVRARLQCLRALPTPFSSEIVSKVVQDLSRAADLYELSGSLDRADQARAFGSAISNNVAIDEGSALGLRLRVETGRAINQVVQTLLDRAT
ncbi:hypothetical protein ACM66B_000232 [Microbotryomycetes sp. NB124-2]